ncbi:hypothetical protein B0I37DRAFT_183280 [Chaetomium sp. MPI-CAGE-AT-0009]|nr:hypothetical protein B0I37DRAFT_183280 [Chaetomium sp. MPI-CAGE-AT-0009]
MDLLQPERRSASHGSLDDNSVVEAQQRPPVPLSPSRAQFRANKAPFHLASPAPLGSMLKKTTETGDIYLFSSNPLHSISASHISSEPKLGWGELTSTERSPIDSVETPDLIDDRRSLPSYRNGTSEIVSLDEFDSKYSQPQQLSIHPLARVSSRYDQRSSSFTSTISMDERDGQLSPIKHFFQAYPTDTVSHSSSEDTHDGRGDVPPVPGPPPVTPTSVLETSQADTSD